MSPRTSNKSGGTRSTSAAAPAKKTTRSASGAAGKLSKKPVKQIVDGRLAKSGAKPPRAPRTAKPRELDESAPRARMVRTQVAAAKSAAAAAAGAITKPARKSAARSAPANAVDGLPKRKRVVKTVAQVEALRTAVLAALEEMKARDVVSLDVREKTSITDWFIIVSGTSSRHVKSLADEVVKAAKALNLPPLGVEGEGEGDWVVVDLGDIVVHVMQPRAREFYALEKLWGVGGDPWLEAPTD